MMSIDMPTKCWFIRWYLFHVDDMKNGETSTVRREAPRRIFCRKRYPARPCGLPEQKIAGAGLSDPAECGRQNSCRVLPHSLPGKHLLQESGL